VAFFVSRMQDFFVSIDKGIRTYERIKIFHHEKIISKSKGGVELTFFP